MSRIGQLLELKNLRERQAAIEQREQERERVVQNLIDSYADLSERLRTVEERKGPGRPPKAQT
jgi:hypothetical protein